MITRTAGSKFSRRAFTLPETTMAVGIVAMVALPVLAMLARSGSMETVSRDRCDAAVVAEELFHSLHVDDKGALLLLNPGRDPVFLDGPAHFVAIDESGAVLRVISAGEYQAGLVSEPAAAFVVEIRLQDAAGNLLRDLDLIVEQPASAAAGARSRDRFQSRVSAR